MTFKELLENKEITAYRLSKDSGVPFSTISDLLNGKSKPENIRLTHALLLSDVLCVDVKELASLEMPRENVEFRYFRSNVLHDLRRKGDKNFIQYILNAKIIDTEYKRGEIECALYLLALVEYLDRVNGFNLRIGRYKKLKGMTLPSVLFPGSDLIHFDTVKDAEDRIGVELIPEFAKYNIVEESVRNAI